MRKLWMLLAAFSLAAAAADVSGTWKGTAETQNGTIERTFVFKVAGKTLTGETTSSFAGKSVIEEGKIDGDDLSFSITADFQGNKMRLNYKGKVSGDTMKLHVEAQDGGFSIDYTAKKVS